MCLWNDDTRSSPLLRGVQFTNNHVYFIVDSDYIYVKEVNRNGNILYWKGVAEHDNMYKEDHSIKIIHKQEEDYFKKIA